MPEPTPETALIHLPVTDFLDRLAGATPAPGGGSAIAMAAAMAASLAAMVAGLTLRKPGYAAVGDEMAGLRDQALALQARLAELIDADAAAYDRVSAAYRLPKGTPDEAGRRQAAIQQALQGASQPPLETAVACVEIIDLAAQAVTRGSRSAASDALVAAWLAEAGLRGAARNVRDNLRTVHDRAFVSAALARLVELRASGSTALAQAMAAAGEGG